MREQTILVVPAELLGILSSALRLGLRLRLLSPGCRVKTNGRRVAEMRGKKSCDEKWGAGSIAEYHWHKHDGKHFDLPSWAQSRSEKTAIANEVVMSSERLRRRASGRNTNQ